MKYKVKTKEVRLLSKNQVQRIYAVGMRTIPKFPTLVKLVMEEWSSPEEEIQLLEAMHREASEVIQDLYSDYPKLPRKRKKALKQKLSANNNAYMVVQSLVFFRG